MKQLTTFEFTEEIKCFSSLRQNLLTRLRKADRDKGANRGTRALNLSNQLEIVERHLLQCFQQREELS